MLPHTFLHSSTGTRSFPKAIMYLKSCNSSSLKFASTFHSTSTSGITARFCEGKVYFQE